MYEDTEFYKLFHQNLTKREEEINAEIEKLEERLKNELLFAYYKSSSEWALKSVEQTKEKISEVREILKELYRMRYILFGCGN